MSILNNILYTTSLFFWLNALFGRRGHGSRPYSCGCCNQS